MNSDVTAEARVRRQSWRGTKKYVKRALSFSIPHLAMRAGVALYPRELDRYRLPAPARLRSVTARMAGVEFVMLDPARCIVAKELYWGHGRRPRPADQAALDVFAALARGADLVLDIGSYTGIFAVLAAKVAPQARVHAFELIPASAQAAIDNVVANDLLDRVDVHLRGIGPDGEHVRVPAGRDGSALPDFLSTTMTFEDGVRVPLVSLDSVLAEHLTAAGPGAEQPDRVVMKIDVEGAEDGVLAGGSKLLGLRPDILCEILPEANTEGVRESLVPHGYRYYPVGARGLEPERELKADPDHRDWVFTCREHTELDRLGVLARL